MLAVKFLIQQIKAGALGAPAFGEGIFVTYGV